MSSPGGGVAEFGPWRVAVKGALVFAMAAAAASFAAPASGSNYYGAPGAPSWKHWNDGNDNVSVVTFVDHTGPSWPVNAAHQVWDNAGRVDVDWRADTCGSASHCVGVAVSDPDQNPVFGGASCFDMGGYVLQVPNSTVTHYSDETYVRFNQRCGSGQYTNRDRQALACEEEGHVVSLRHATYSGANNDTCMGSGWIAVLEETPQQHDFVMIDDEVYLHND